MYAGLVDAYLYCNNEEAKDVVTKCADWLINITSNLDEAKFQQMISCEIGGMSEVLDAIYILTGEQKYLDIAKKFYHKARRGHSDASGRAADEHYVRLGARARGSPRRGHPRGAEIRSLRLVQDLHQVHYPPGHAAGAVRPDQGVLLLSNTYS